jgi:hypothetical protein
MAAMSCQFIAPLSAVLPQIMKKVALNPYLSKIGFTYMKSPFLLSSNDKITTLLLLFVAKPLLPATTLSDAVAVVVEDLVCTDGLLSAIFG